MQRLASGARTKSVQKELNGINKNIVGDLR